MSVRSTLGPFGIVTVAAMEAINAHPDGTPTVLAVYVALTTKADRTENEAWRASNKQLAELAGVSAKSVTRAKAVLRELGLVEVTPNWTVDGDRGWDSHLIHFAAWGGDDVGGGGDKLTRYIGTDQVTDQYPLSPPEKSETELFTATPPTPKGERDDPSFVAFAERYPSRAKRNMKVSARRWAKLSKADRAKASDGLQPWLNYWKTERTDGQYIPAMEVWIGTSGNRGKGRGWETEPPRKARRPQTDLESQQRMSGQIV